jgi:catechol 2,3-dioxygenase-like lactoylglutathione lyase family enzyme
MKWGATNTIAQLIHLRASAEVHAIGRQLPLSPKPKKLDMSDTLVRSETATGTPGARTVDMKLEAVVIPVSDVDRAKRSYGDLAWTLDADFAVGDTFRVVQFTPPGSPCSIHFGTGVTSAAPRSAQGLYLFVSDIEAARAELVERGADVSEVLHRTGPGMPIKGRHPERGSYASFASFSDPDGNVSRMVGWVSAVAGGGHARGP